MITAASIVQGFRGRGITLTATDRDTIRVAPAEKLTDADRELLRKHKADVLAELQAVNLVYLVNIDSGCLPDSRYIPDEYNGFPDRAEAAQTLLETMRAIGLRVRLTAQGELRIGPSWMLWPYDRATIAELKQELIEILRKEMHP